MRKQGVGDGGVWEDEALAAAGVLRHEVHALRAREGAVAARGKEENNKERREDEGDEDEYGAGEEEVRVGDEASGEKDDRQDDCDCREGGDGISGPVL